jgi:hypothetical protein
MEVSYIETNTLFGGCWDGQQHQQLKVKKNDTFSLESMLSSGYVLPRRNNELFIFDLNKTKS